MMNVSQTIIQLLHNRGIEGEREIQEFLSSKPKRTYNPSLLDDLEAGVDFLLEKIKTGAKICIYGDYDADGITSTTLMLSILGHLMPEERLDYYIPSRFEEGYGLNKDAILSIFKKGFDLIVTVDCGSVSAGEVQYAKELGMDIIVTDHHNITDTMAECLLINPKKPGSKYPFQELCGCGVAFKMAQLIQKKCGLPKHVLTEVLDLVAIGTMGDIMPLVDENRTMAKFGLQVVNSGSRYGLKKLMEGAGLHPGQITSENISYVIVPHLNASGRIEDASQAVELLSAKDGDPETDEIVEDLLFKNRERKRLQQETFEECVEMVRNSGTDDFLLIESENAHEGIAGIAAGKIKDEFYRPTVLVTPSGDQKQYLKGTGRSIEGVDLYSLLKNHEDLFEKFGGHKSACGFLMKKENFRLLKDGLLADMKVLLTENPALFVRKHPVDMELPFEDISLQLAEELEQLAPFGNKNPKPAFRISPVRIRDVRLMGATGKHVRFNIFDGRGRSLTCVLFNKAEKYMDTLTSGNIVAVIGSLEAQTWQNVTRLQMITDEIECL